MTLKANVVSWELTIRTSSAILGVGNKTPEYITQSFLMKFCVFVVFFHQLQT